MLAPELEAGDGMTTQMLPQHLLCSRWLAAHSPRLGPKLVPQVRRWTLASHVTPTGSPQHNPRSLRRTTRPSLSVSRGSRPELPSPPCGEGPGERCPDDPRFVRATQKPGPHTGTGSTSIPRYHPRCLAAARRAPSRPALLTGASGRAYRPSCRTAYAGRLRRSARQLGSDLPSRGLRPAHTVPGFARQPLAMYSSPSSPVRQVYVEAGAACQRRRFGACVAGDCLCRRHAGVSRPSASARTNTAAVAPWRMRTMLMDFARSGEPE